MTATGPQDKTPAVTFFLTNRAVDKLTDAVSQHFLGVQLACAQCHNHPFTDWKQTEYWGMAAAFSKVQPDRPGNPLKKGDDTPPGVRELATRSRAKDFFPEGAKTVPVKFLGTDGDAKLKTSEPYRPALADWMTAKENPFFAKAMVNRTWFHLFGRGFVAPVDDMHDDNPGQPPGTAERAGRAVRRRRVRPQAAHPRHRHQPGRTSGPASRPPPSRPPTCSAGQAVKVMGPEMLFDSLTRVTGVNLEAAKGKQEEQGPEPAQGGAVLAPGSVRRLLPGRGRVRQPGRVRRRHPAGAQADEQPPADRRPRGGPEVREGGRPGAEERRGPVPGGPQPAGRRPPR